MNNNPTSQTVRFWNWAGSSGDSGISIYFRNSNSELISSRIRRISTLLRTYKSVLQKKQKPLNIDEKPNDLAQVLFITVSSDFLSLFVCLYLTGSSDT